jgi:hypothetical protein
MVTWDNHLLPDYMQALLQAVDSIGDDPEVMPPNSLLRAVEHGMVGCHQLQHATCDRKAGVIERLLAEPVTKGA